jgi:ABC-type bacteriocin/lantibiotic exporter with double-glycine peptidase domain
MIVNKILSLVGSKGAISIGFLAILSAIQVIGLRDIGLNLSSELGIGKSLQPFLNIYLAIFLTLITSILSSFVTFKLMEHVTKEMIARIKKVFYLDLVNFTSKNNNGEFTNRYGSEIARLQNTFTNNLATGMAQLVVVMAIYTYLLVFHYFFTIFLSLFIFAGILLIIFILRPMQRSLGQKIEEFSKVALNGIRMFSLGRLGIFIERLNRQAAKLYEGLITQWMSHIVKSTFWSQQGKIVFEFAIFLSLGLIVYLSQNTDYGKYFRSEDIVIIGSMSIKLLPGLNALSNSLQGVFANWTLFSMIVNHEPHKKEEKEETNYIQIKESDGQVLIEHNNIEYKSNNRWVELEGITGCGKSTYLKELLRFSNPKAKKLFYAPQDPIFLPINVHEYLTMGLTNTNQNLIKEYAKVLGLANNDLELDLFLRKNLAAEVTPFSGGERQRLIILRMLLVEPEIAYLDEVTAALDYQTESQVISLIRDRLPDTIVIFISHSAMMKKQSHIRLKIRSCDVYEVETS